MGELQRSRIVRHIQERYSTEPEHLWARYPDYMVFRHPASKKWYAAILDAPRNKLGLSGESSVDILDIKCDSRMIGSLLTENGFLPAYHMNKTTWISILLDDSVTDEQILPLLELSYDSVAPKRKKRGDRRAGEPEAE